MLFTNAGQTPYDLSFSLLGVPIRIHPAFWVVALFLGSQQSLEGALLWVGCVLLSILVHEMGHAIVQRFFGGRPEIVLYAFGGFAAAPGVRDSPWRNVLISLAGPAAGFALFGVVKAIDLAGVITPTPRADYVIYALITINFFWSLLNLAPIWPLDGGRVAREACTGLLPPATGIVVSLWVSILCGVALAIYLFQVTHSPWNAALFGMLAYQSYESLQQYRASRGGW